MQEIEIKEKLKSWLRGDDTKLFLVALKKYRLKYMNILAINNSCGNGKDYLQHELGKLAGIKFIIDFIEDMQLIEEENNKNNKDQQLNESLIELVDLCKNDILTLIE